MECAMSMTGIQESFNLDSSGSNKVSGETIGGGLNLAFDLFGVSARSFISCSVFRSQVYNLFELLLVLK